MNGLAAFDLETASIAPDDAGRRASWQLGITCAALAGPGSAGVRLWVGADRMTRAQAVELVEDLQRTAAQGTTLVTWNGCKFDFQILASESGLRSECSELARNHVDLMMMVTFRKGWFVSLDSALRGTGLPGKVTEVRLRDGTLLSSMSGKQAPELWARGEREAVLAYLTGDVEQLLQLVLLVRARRRIDWLSRNGTLQSIAAPRLLTVRECLDLPMVSVPWMDNPPNRADFIAWME